MIGRRACLALSLVGLPVAISIGATSIGAPSIARAQSAPSRLALKGYDPVAYFTDSKAMPGDPQYEAAYDGVRYRFASAQHLGLFKADPDRYAPQFGGSCAAGIAMGVKFESEPENWLIVDGRLFVFSSAKSLDSVRADTAGMVAKGRENWKTLADAPYQ
jgi:YHS domain-containing protein